MFKLIGKCVMKLYETSPNGPDSGPDFIDASDDAFASSSSSLMLT
jgi:hypothetical protein